MLGDLERRRPRLEHRDGQRGGSSIGTLFLSMLPKGAASSFDSKDVEAQELAADASTEAEAAELYVKKSIDIANEAAEDALGAAEVAVWTETIGAIGTFAGLLATVVGW